MTRSERETLQKRIVQFHLNYAKSKENITVNHFLKEKISRQTTYNIIRKYEETSYIGDRPRFGRPKKLHQRQLSRLKRLTNHKTGVSLCL